MGWRRSGSGPRRKGSSRLIMPRRARPRQGEKGHPGEVHGCGAWGLGGSPAAPQLQCSGRVQCIAYPACLYACVTQPVPAPHRRRGQRHHPWAGHQGGAQRAAHQRPLSLGTLAPGSLARLLAQPKRAVPAAAGSLGLPVTGNAPPLVMCLGGGGAGESLTDFICALPNTHPHRHPGKQEGKRHEETGHMSRARGH